MVLPSSRPEPAEGQTGDRGAGAVVGDVVGGERASALAIAFAAFLFGTSFVVVKHGLADVKPIPFLAIRFTVAAAVFAPLAWLRRSRRAVGEWRLGLTTGLVYFTSLVGQTMGLDRTTPSTAAFLTYLLVVAVPAIEFVRNRRLPTRRVVLAIVVAMVGLVLLTGAGVGFGTGELLCLAGAVGFAYHLIQVGEGATRLDPFRFNFAHCVGAAVPALLLAPFTGGLPTAARGWGVGLYTGVVVTVGTLVPWAWAQKRISATRAALIFLLEPVFAAFTSALDGERMRTGTLVGAALILVGAVLAET